MIDSFKEKPELEKTISEKEDKISIKDRLFYNNLFFISIIDWQFIILMLKF